jgi:hypothetical protein
MKTEADLKANEKLLVGMIKKFTKEENKEYLTKYKELFTTIYSRTPNALKINRMREISEISLREPIDLTKPILFIEYITLASVTEPFSAQYKDSKILDDYIEQFVESRFK